MAKYDWIELRVSQDRVDELMGPDLRKIGFSIHESLGFLIFRDLTQLQPITKFNVSVTIGIENQQK